MPLKITRGSEIKFNTDVIAIPEDEMIYAAGPAFDEGSGNAEELLRSGYRKSLALAEQKGPGPIALSLIPAEDLGLSKEENLRIAVDESRSFLETSDRSIYLIVDDEKEPRHRELLRTRLDFYLGRYSAWERQAAAFGSGKHAPRPSANSKPAPGHVPSVGHAPSADHMPVLSHAPSAGCSDLAFDEPRQEAKKERERKPWWRRREKDAPSAADDYEDAGDEAYKEAAFDELEEGDALDELALGAGGALSALVENDALEAPKAQVPLASHAMAAAPAPSEEIDEIEELDRKIKERLKHLSDTFSQYLLYLIEQKGMDNAEVYKRAIVDKKVFSKIKNNPNYHPQRMTALCLCIGAKLNLDESRDLLARAGYALSPSSKTDAIFSFFIENGIYDMIELDIQLEEHGLPCIIT